MLYSKPFMVCVYIMERLPPIAQHRVVASASSSSLSPEELSNAKSSDSTPASTPRMARDIVDDLSPRYKHIAIENHHHHRVGEVSSLGLPPLPPPTSSHSATERRLTCPVCRTAQSVVVLGYWRDYEAYVYYCGNTDVTAADAAKLSSRSTPCPRRTMTPLDDAERRRMLMEHYNPTKQAVDEFHGYHTFNVRDDDDDDDCSAVVAAVPKHRHSMRSSRLLSFFKSSTTPSESSTPVTASTRSRKNTKSKSSDAAVKSETTTTIVFKPSPSDDEEEAAEANPITTICGHVWIPTMRFHAIERIVLQYDTQLKRMIIVRCE